MMADGKGLAATFEWTADRMEAAQRLGEEEYSDREIAEMVGIARSTLANWKKYPEFAEAVDTHRREALERMRRHRLATIEGRVRAKIDRHEALTQLMHERGKRAEEEGDTAPGRRTGLVIRKHVKLSRTEFVTEDCVDTALLDALNELEESLAEELGQRTNKVHVNLNHEVKFAAQRLDDLIGKIVDVTPEAEVPGLPDRSGEGGP